MSPSRRAMSRVRRALGHTIPTWYHPAFRLPLAGVETALGIDPRRADHVLTWLMDLGIVGSGELREPRMAAWEDIERVHHPEYLAGLDRPRTLARILGLDPGRIPAGSVLEMWRLATGGVIEATREVSERGGRAACLLGGFHHAWPDHGAGFCGISDVAVALRLAREAGLEGPVAVLDLDAHPPDGLTACLASDPHTRVLSLGVASDWEVPEGAFDHRVPPGTDDKAYLAALDTLLAEVGRPVLAVVLAGADPLRGDRFGGLACTEDGLYERDRRVLQLLGSTPTVLLPAGGYTPGAWRVFAHTLALAAGRAQRVPPDYDPILRRTRAISRALDPGSLGAEEAWLSEDDLREALGLPGPVEPRLLGFYTRQGIEYALTRFGLLDALRRMGFRDLQVLLDADGIPHRVRVTAAVDGARETIIDLALSIKDLDRWQLLFVEWLEVRDPRVRFTGTRPRLPGQRSPGLGLAEEVGHMLVRVARRLGLAGVGIVPAHYHVAWMGRHRFRFADPEAQGRFLALCRHLAAVPLLRASTDLDSDGLPVEAGDPVRWTPSLMVTPIDPGLKAWLEEGDDRAEQVAESLSARLLG